MNILDLIEEYFDTVETIHDVIDTGAAIKDAGKTRKKRTFTTLCEELKSSSNTGRQMKVTRLEQGQSFLSAVEKTDAKTSFLNHSIFLGEPQTGLDVEGMDAETLFMTGIEYLQGEQGKPQEFDTAAKYIEEAAYRDYAEAYTAMGLFYLNGVGVPQSDEEALNWLGTAATEKFSLDAAVHYADLLLKVYREHGHNTAAHWYEMAAAEGNRTAQAALVGLYMNSEIMRDYDKSVYWMRVLAESGYEEVAEMLHGIDSSGNDGNPAKLGPAFFYGTDGMEQDYEKAYYFMLKWAESGDPKGQYELARMCEKNVSDDFGDYQADLWFRKAAEQGFAG